jgi:hypothetical protein
VNNGSDLGPENDLAEKRADCYMAYPDNVGIIQVFADVFSRQHESNGAIVGFIHSDLLIHEPEWDRKIKEAFAEHPKLGILGFLGGQGVAPDGGRIRVMSKMLGKEWGGCECHELTASHHGELMESFAFGAVLDGCAMFFRQSCAKDLLENTNALDPSFRPLHHWYDRNLSLFAIDRGWQVGILGIGFDHFSGATANVSDKYGDSVKKWAEDTGRDIGDKAPDQFSYDLGLEQFNQEWAWRLNCVADENGNYRWRK